MIRRTYLTFVKETLPDPILGLTVLFNKDKSPNKINLGVGVYKDNNGNSYTLDAVKLAQSKQVNKSLEYGPIEGIQSFISATQKLAFGNNKELIDRTATVQTLSGTGSLKLAAEFLRQYKNELNNPIIYIPEPTWPNHKNILSQSELNFDTYDYYNKKLNNINFDKMINKLNKIKSNQNLLYYFMHVLIIQQEQTHQ